MKITEINPESVKTISDRELLNMHRRCHQLYTMYRRSHWKNKSEMIKTAHIDIVNEMERRGMKHNSPLKYLNETIEDYI